MNVRAILYAEYLRQRRLPFVWGVRDCGTWCADCALAVTGRDPAPELRGVYDSEISARRLMIDRGWRNMGDFAASIFPEIAVAQARSGDWAHVEQGERDGLGVVVADKIAVRSLDGLGLVPLSAAARAFRVT